MYDEIQAAVDAGIPLDDCDCCNRLEQLAENSFNMEEMLLDPNEKPLEKDFYDEEDDEWKKAYDEAIEEYYSQLHSYFLEACWMDDPGDITRLLQSLRNYHFKEYAGKEERFTINEDEYIIAEHSFTAKFDENGVVAKLFDFESRGLESQTMKYSRYGETYPNFKLIRGELIKMSDEQE